jgi:hypothetical protein
MNAAPLMRVRIVALLLIVWSTLLFLGGPLATAAEPQAKRTGPLAELPPKAGAHVEKIKTLGDNEWLDLGPPAADPKWGKGRGRSWGSKMPYAPDLLGAFLAGQGQHGFIKPDGRYDDIFFYDCQAHRWICIYPGLVTRSFVDDIKKGELKVNDDGQLVDRDGQPVFYAYGGHSYQGHTYDTDLRKYVTVGAQTNLPGLGGDQYSAQMAWEKEGKKLLQEQMKTDRVAGSPFFFNTITGKFEHSPSDGPKNLGSFPSLFYLPTKKSFWCYSRGDLQFFDSASNKWSKAGAKGAVPPGIDFGICLDSKRDRLYVCGGNYRPAYGKDEGKIYVYDVKTNSWSNQPDKGTVPDRFASNDACVHYDSANDRLITVVYSGDRRGVYVFDPQTSSWGEKPLPFPAKFPAQCWHGFYAPELNAHFFYLAGDSQDNGTMWVYRYKRAAQ